MTFFNYVLPQAFSLGPVVIHYYGITMALAVLAGWWLANYRAGVFGLSSEYLDKLFVRLVIGGFVGARVYHVFSSWAYYLQYPLEIVQVWHGGLSIFGALGGAFVVLFIYQRLHSLKVSFLQLLDLLALPVLLGQIIGRFGNLFNYEALGGPTNLPWGLFVPASFRPESFKDFAFFHPFPVYEQVLNLVCLLVLLRFEKRFKLAPGAVFFGYLFLYGGVRFSLEWLRTDSVLLWGQVPVNAVTSLLMCGIGFAWLIFHQKKFERINLES